MPADSALTFGVLLKRYRRTAGGMTQEALAERAGFSAVYISMLERGTRQPLRSTVALLADALGLTAEDRGTLEAAALLPLIPAAMSRSASHTAVGPCLPIGGFLGALPEGPLVAREAELARLHVLLDAVASGSQGRVVLLVGEPGIGKTRLAQEVALLAQQRGFLVTSGCCYEPQEGVAYYPFLEVLSSAVAAAPMSVREQLPQRWPEVVRLLPDSPLEGALPAASLPSGTSTGGVQNRDEQQRLFWQVAGFVGALAEAQPVALLLDDVHWADSASLELVQHLARRTRGARVLLLGTYRDVAVNRQHPLVSLLHDLVREHLVERVPIRRLSVGGTHQLIKAALEQAQVPRAFASEEFAQVLYTRTEGNPFFTHEVLQALIEQGTVFRGGSAWDRATLERLAIPESIRLVIGQRVAQLSLVTQEQLHEASVLGQTFTFAEVEALGRLSSGRGEAAVEAALAEAEAAGLVHEAGAGGAGGETYGFQHALIQHTLYQDLPTRRKRRLHRMAGETLEMLSSKRGEHGAPRQRAAELAYHFLEADEGARALPYVLLAGDGAEALYAHAEAERHYRTALEVARETGARAGEAEALEKLGLVLRARAHRTEALEVLERAAHVYQELGDTEAELRSLAALGMLFWAQPEDADQALARLLPRLAVLEQQRSTGSSPSAALFAIYETLTLLYISWGRWAEADEVFARAEQIARTLGDEALLVCVLSLRMRREELATNVAPMALALELIALAERVGDIRSLMAGLDVAYNGSLYAGDLAQAQQHVERWATLAERVGMVEGIAFTRGNSGEVAFYRGDWGQARAAFEQVWALCTEMEQLGAPEISGSYASWLGVLELAEGRDQEAVEHLTMTLDLARKHQAKRFIAEIGGLLAERDLVAGRAAEARTHLEELLSLPGVRTHAAGAALALPNLAWAEAEVGEVDRAAATVEDGIACIATAHCQLFLPEALRIRALISAKQRRWEAAEADVVRAIEMAQAMRYPYAEAKARYVYGQVHLAKGEVEQAHAQYEQACSICARLGEGLYRSHIERALAELRSDGDSNTAGH
jgi:transcriptional regulator with XRE-family HTH domain/tetratricopeptide (TPR) repeat protein